jgi:catechol 2,3-dioxygenase-like lactoylglutathione lyase family enzyme
MKTVDPPTNLQLRRILETALYADDLDRAETFYTSVLGLRVFAKEIGRHLFFKFSDQMLLIFNPAKTSQESETVPHGCHGAGHIAFGVPSSELDGWKQNLQSNGVEIEQDIRWPNGARSLYFRDPAGNCLELASPLVWGMEDTIEPGPA